MSNQSESLFFFPHYLWVDYPSCGLTMPWIQTSALAVSRARLVRQDLLVQAQCHVDIGALLPGPVLPPKWCSVGPELIGLAGSELMSSKIRLAVSPWCF